MNKEQKRLLTIAIVASVLSLAVIIGTILYYLVDLMLRVAVLEAEVRHLKGELKEQNTRQLKPIQPDRGGDVL